ncbi:hypothetical protein DLJ53_33965 [Acuticoccus sediminis]|uniref:Uncharacterized protein n=1 Tax=Acuticoccus sediminis TaxID=2184697 RepID=A0A8B2NG10_9HYPH|nr:hypothetical protein [Acuticoccus sediminis]RAH95797.1 hypothetical protein DLJ53_33965 [Acuticoccus sediminis]
MAIARKPRATVQAPAITASEREIEALIYKGGSVAEAPSPAPTAGRVAAGVRQDTAKVILRLPSEMLGRIDHLVDARNPRIPRHTWLLEAILEKLDRETIR